MDSLGCQDTIPRSCAESFADMRQTLGRLTTVAEATHRQVTAIDTRVGDLYDASRDHQADLARLECEVETLRAKQADHESLAVKVLALGWRVAVMLAAGAASVLGVKNCLNFMR